MKPKPIVKVSRRKLKNLKHLTFVRREFRKPSESCGWDEVWDWFMSQKHSIRVVRVMTRINARHYVMWYCPELGSGNASLSYWFSLAEKGQQK